ncbi:MAG TPA: chromosome segregation protein SMC [Candidatus Rifleibacterium sp.]|nr:chromosome segregation protein SMC [Candidatus Rifleibacterium sp.]HPT45416.1 chromosome segregation protein SMC [Candidatus Rifleibacterium sp.]
MYLKSLELMGFKSFGRKTVFDFTQGITAIIGPNGSGKSNVCDAIRWVLGEQSAKALRGTKMSEVIFAGSAELKASAFAQVKLILDNEDHAMPMDFSEVSIGRQLFRSGESNYFVNNSRTLMSSIKEMLMDTGIGKDGYSVIGQGDIDDIIFQRTQSRRALIEEAAGITKFKHRKQNTLTKLGHTRTNITRLRDITSEIEGQLGPLAEQAEKTRKYQALAGEIRQLEIDLILFDLSQLNGEFENINSMRLGLLAKIEEIEKFLAEVDAKKADARVRFAEFESVLQTRQDEVKTVVVQIDDRRRQMAALREDLKSQQARSQAILEEIDGIESLLLDGGQEISDAENRFKDEETREIELAAVMADLEGNVDEVRAELDKHLREQSSDKQSVFDVAVALADRRNRITTVTQQIQILERQLDKGEGDVTSARNHVNSLQAENEKTETEIATMKAEIEKNRTLLSEEMARLNKVEKDHKRTEEELTGVSDGIKMARARLNLFEELRHSSDSGIFRGVQAALALKETGRLPGIHGIVGDLIKVPAGYEVAIETALGGSIQDIITQDAETAKAAIDMLKQNKAGRATFLPLDIMTAPPALGRAEARGCLGAALELIEFDAKFYTVMSNLLGRILIFDNLDNAVEFTRKNRNFNRIVTVDGEIIRSSGAMTGGGEARKSGGILSRKREQEELEEKLKVLESKEGKLRSLMNNLLRERQTLNNSTRERDDMVRRREQSLGFFERTRDKNTQELKTRSEEYSNIARDRAEMTTRLDALRHELVQAGAELASIEKQHTELSGRLNALSGREGAIQARLSGLVSMLGERKLEMAQIVERKKAIKKEIEAATRRRRDAAERKERAASEVERLKGLTCEGEKNVSAVQTGIDELEKRKETLESAMETIQNDYRRMSKELDQLDHAYQSRVRIEDSTRKKLSELDIKLTEVKTHISTKEGILSGEFNIDLNDHGFKPNKYESRDELAGRINQRRFEQEVLGAVNPLAIEDYEKTRERYDFLNSQIADMTDAADSLEQVIAEIEKISSERFLETFGQINVAFNDIFEILFPGGSGMLKLTDPNIPLESDVDIVCRLPGKKLSTLELFSGGEKALISLALLFSILQVKPPAFCLLDEVEAALDEANVRRFTRMLRSFADKTQFLVITHNKETMQAVDVIYGVTLQKSGISRPISIRLEDDDKIKEFTVSKAGGMKERNYAVATAGSATEENMQ